MICGYLVLGEEKNIMNTLFMALASFKGRARQKANPEIRPAPPQTPFSHTLFVHQLYDSQLPQPRVYDDANSGISGPYDDDGKPE